MSGGRLDVIYSCFRCCDITLSHMHSFYGTVSSAMLSQANGQIPLLGSLCASKLLVHGNTNVLQPLIQIGVYSFALGC